VVPFAEAAVTIAAVAPTVFVQAASELVARPAKAETSLVVEELLYVESGMCAV